MSEPEKTVESEQSANGNGEPTQIGQLVRPNGNVTRQISTQQSQRATNSALRERITTLIAALGDTEHPLHQQAVQDLVAIGDPAVPALNEALSPRRPWLTTFRAAEALGQIGDGRATSALIEALRHPNSNVRWGAVRALAVIGDARAMLDLRRVARTDRAKTSWGESVSGAAESALDQMRSQNVIFRSAELVKTALACVVMLVALVIAWSVVSTLRSDLDRVGKDQVDPAALFAPVTPTIDPLATPTAAADATVEAAAEATPEAALEATAGPDDAAATLPAASTVVTGTALSVANVRSEPTSQRQNKIGNLNQGDDVIFLAISPDNRWYRVQLGERRKASSQINSLDGTGWVIANLLSPPSGDVPVEEVPAPSDSEATPTAAP